MINGITSSDLNAYVEHLKNENQTVKTADLSFSLEDYLDTPDAESCIEISDSTLQNADKDFLEENADKLANFGVTKEQICTLTGGSETAEDTKEKDTKKNADNSAASNDLSAIINQNHKLKAEDAKIIKDVKKQEAKNNQERAKLETNILNAQKQNEYLNEIYSALNAKVSAEEDIKEQQANAQAAEYENAMIGKMDAQEASKTEQSKKIEADNTEVKEQNAFTKGFKADSSEHFSSVNIAINSSSDSLDNSKGYTLAGDNMNFTGIEVMEKGETINDSAITLAQTGLNMLANKNTAKEGQVVYDRAITLANDSFETITSGQEVALGAEKYYDQSKKYTNNGNMFMSKMTASVGNINSNNDILSNKIQELQSKEV